MVRELAVLMGVDRAAERLVKSVDLLQGGALDELHQHNLKYIQQTIPQLKLGGGFSDAIQKLRHLMRSKLFLESSVEQQLLPMEPVLPFAEVINRLVDFWQVTDRKHILSASEHTRALFPNMVNLAKLSSIVSFDIDALAECIDYVGSSELNNWEQYVLESVFNFKSDLCEIFKSPLRGERSVLQLS